MSEGGTISTSTGGNGNGGSVVVNASEAVEIYGSSSTPIGLERSKITSGAEPPTTLLRRLLRLPAQPSGNSGNVTINTNTLRISSGGSVSIQNEGTGNAGTLILNANLIALSDQGRITASTKFGEGGNINLRSESLRLRQGSTITAIAGNNGNGGNINIKAPTILGLEDSDIVANAFQGRGGNIQVLTQGIFGLKYRDRLTAENDITASSEFGINGNVQVNTIGINPANSLNELPVDVADSSRQIADRCGAAKTSSFIATGRGGIPQNPSKKKGSDRPWNDLRTIGIDRSAITAAITPIVQAPIVEASALRNNPDGSID